MESSIVIRLHIEDEDLESIYLEINWNGIKIKASICPSNDDDFLPINKLQDLVKQMKLNSKCDIIFDSCNGGAFIYTNNGVTTFEISKEANEMTISIPNNLCIEHFEKLIDDLNSLHSNTD